MEDTRKLFRAHGIRCTKQRLALWDALQKSKVHPTADELFRLVQCPSLSRATVYNTLEALCKAGLVRQMPGTNGCCRYDADMADHLHFCCHDSREISDVPAELGRRLLERLPRGVLAEIEVKMGVHIENVSVQLSGRKRL